MKTVIENAVSSLTYALNKKGGRDLHPEMQKKYNIYYVKEELRFIAATYLYSGETVKVKDENSPLFGEELVIIEVFRGDSETADEINFVMDVDRFSKTKGMGSGRHVMSEIQIEIINKA